MKVVKKNADKSKEPFMGILTPEQISEGAAIFRKEIQNKVKPILYHNIKEKNEIEAKMISEISQEERLIISHALTDFFADLHSHSSGHKDIS